MDFRRDVEVFTPFPVDSITHSMHRTYLDSIGRPAITIKKAHCTENHAQTVYVGYSTCPPWLPRPADTPRTGLLHVPRVLAPAQAADRRRRGSRLVHARSGTETGGLQHRAEEVIAADIAVAVGVGVQARKRDKMHTSEKSEVTGPRCVQGP